MYKINDKPSEYVSTGYSVRSLITQLYVIPLSMLSFNTFTQSSISIC